MGQWDILKTWPSEEIKKDYYEKQEYLDNQTIHLGNIDDNNEFKDGKNSISSFDFLIHLVHKLVCTTNSELLMF